jgi:tetratricopeptide (TPR) repeat protein
VKTIRTWLWPASALAAVVLAVWGGLSYRPPLLDSGGRNPPERIADFFAYSWFYSKSLWLENTRRPGAADAAALTAAWFRPSLLASRFRIDSSDPLALAGEYGQRGLAGRAGRLLELAAARTDDPTRLGEIISCAAALNDWESLAAILAAVDPRLLAAANGDYWRGRTLLELGRSAEAIPFLTLAAAGDLADASYRLSLALRVAGREKEAALSLLRAVDLSPDHPEAARACADLLRGSGKAEVGEALRLRAKSLTPALPVRAVFGGLRILGFDPPSPRLKGEETLRCRMFYEVIGDVPEALTARLSLQRENRPGAAREEAIPMGRADPGVVRTAVWEFSLPAEIVPGSYRVMIGFSRPPDKPLRRLGSGEEEIACGETAVLPGVFAVPYADRHLGELFGTDLDNLRLSAVLNNRDRVSFPLDSARPRSGVGIVSYTQWSTALPQGTRVAEIEVKTAEGEVHRFPIEAGVQTADIWLGDRAEAERAHGFAPLYRSREVQRGEKKATANAYYFVFRLPRPARLSSAAIEYVHPAAGALFIQNVFLL